MSHTGGSGLPAADTRRDRARGVARLRALSEVGRAGVGLSQSEGTKRILLAAMRASEADEASLGVWEAERQALKVRMNVGILAEWEEEEPADEVYEAYHSTWLAGIAEGQLGAVLCLDDPNLAPDDREYLESLHKHSSISVPLLYSGDWWGELFVARSAERPPFTLKDLDWVSAVAAQVSAALESVDHANRIEQLAQTDSMTGLANRRALDVWLNLAMDELRDNETPIGMAVVDLNGLKSINDDQGHDAGDRVLQQLAEILSHAARGLDRAIIARLGGDEFCIAALGIEADEIVAVAHDVCREGWELLPHGLACGVVATTDAIGAVDAPARLLRLADASQYRAKRMHARVPIVAGRPLPQGLSIPHSSDADDVVPDRRLFRGREEPSVGHLTDASLRALDQANDEPPRSRLGLVADLVTHHVDALGWWLSLVPSKSSSVRTVDFALYRRNPAIDPEELRTELAGEFDLNVYPQTQRALTGTSFMVMSTDVGADPAELAILDGLGATAVLAAGGHDEHEDGWLVEVFLDDLSTPSQDLAGVL